MKFILSLSLLLIAAGYTGPVRADIWKWVDMDGYVHYVDSKIPIYTWRDDDGRISFSDRPEHPSAIRAELVWHSTGSLDQPVEEPVASDPGAWPGETAEQRERRKQAEAYYCERAREIYEMYAGAPSLYSTGEDGKRHYLTEEETAATLAETEQRVAELCR
jgi:hypothetical protein